MLAGFEWGVDTAFSVLVTVQGPEQRVELQLPCDRPVMELLPLLVDVCARNGHSEDARWELAPLGGLAFDSARTLLEVGVVDGALLHLRDASLALGPLDWPPPQDPARMVLPPRVPLLDRMTAAAGAV